MDELHHFTVAQAILTTFGGSRSVAWRLAGDLLAEGAGLREVFMALGEDAMERRWEQMHSDHAGV